MKVWVWKAPDGEVAVSPNKPYDDQGCGDPRYSWWSCARFSHPNSVTVCIGTKLFGRLASDKLYTFNLTARRIKTLNS